MALHSPSNKEQQILIFLYSGVIRIGIYKKSGEMGKCRIFTLYDFPLLSGFFLIPMYGGHQDKRANEGDAAPSEVLRERRPHLAHTPVP